MLNRDNIAIRYSTDRDGKPLVHYWASGFSRLVATAPDTIGRWIRVSKSEASGWIAEGRGYVYSTLRGATPEDMATN